MPPHQPRHLLQCEEVSSAWLVRFTVASLRDDRDIQSIFKELDELIERDAQKHLILNFQNVTSIASFFLGKLVELNKKIKQDKGRLVICSPTPIVEEIIDLMQLHRQCDIYQTEQEAIEHF